MEADEKKWNIDPESIKDPGYAKVKKRFDAAKVQMDMRTAHHELYGLLAKNKSIHEWTMRKGRSKYFSEGSTQYILRKTLADTIQRVPDGELQTSFDKATKEHILTQYLFENKVMWSEFEGIDMMSNLTNTFKMAFIYGFAPVRIGFEKDSDDDARIGFNLENWADVYVNPDCKDVRRPEVVYFRSYMDKDSVQALLDDNDEVIDSTYNQDTVRYLIENDMFTGRDYDSEKLADKLKGSTGTHSVMLITEYRRGANEFITYCPSANAVFRRVPNYDPRKGIPWVFCVLEPDPDYPLGLSQIEFLLADQQFNDLFQTSAYKNLLLAMEPPIMVSGWETNPSSYKFEPRKIWNLGNNPNQVKVEPVKIDNSILSNWSTTREAVASSMMRNLNVMDGTIANDSGTGFSKTAPGVEAQQATKTININQYQKRMEYFVSDWANMSLRCYINSMGGVHTMTIDEETRRKLFDIGCFDIVDGDKVDIDFDELSTEMLEFKVRTGSLVELKEDQERAALTEMVQPFIQNLNGWSDDNRRVVEDEILLPVAMRMLELSDTDLSQSLAASLSSQIAKKMMAGMQQQIDGQQQQLDMQGMQMDQMAQAMQLQEPQAQDMEMPVPMGQEDLAPAVPIEDAGVSSPSQPLPPDEDWLGIPSEEIPGEQVIPYDELMAV